MKGFWNDFFNGFKSTKETIKQEQTNSEQQEEKAPIKVNKVNLIAFAIIIIFGLVAYILAHNPFKMLNSEAAVMMKNMESQAKEWCEKNQPDIKVKKLSVKEIKTIPDFGSKYSSEYVYQGTRRIKLYDAIEVINSGDKFLAFVVKEKTDEYKENYQSGKPMTFADSLKMMNDAEYLYILAVALQQKSKQEILTQINTAIAEINLYMADAEKVPGYEVTFNVREVKDGVKENYEYLFVSQKDSLALRYIRKDLIAK